MTDEQNFEALIAVHLSGQAVDVRPWEAVNLLEYVSRRDGDLAALGEELLRAPIPAWRLDEFLDLAAEHGNEGVGLALLEAGASARPLAVACRQGLPLLTAALVERGSRVNRRFASEFAPVHLAAMSARPRETTAVLVRAACDLVVGSPDGRFIWELTSTEYGEELRAAVGTVGPTWFRESQTRGIDHYLFVRDGQMFGFNPNDVQTPVLTGDEDEGFGWPNTASQGLALMEGNFRLRDEAGWFAPFLERIERGEDFSLDELGARVPRMRPSPR